VRSMTNPTNTPRWLATAQTTEEHAAEVHATAHADKRILVRYKETGAIRSIPREKFNPSIHEIVVKRGGDR
jgi:hypothetical protein